MEIPSGFASTYNFELYLHSHFELVANFPATPPRLALSFYVGENLDSISIFQGVHHYWRRGEHVFLQPSGCISQDRHIREQDLQRMLVQALPRPHYLNVELLTFYLSSYGNLVFRQFPMVCGGTMVICAMIVPRFIARHGLFSGVVHGDDQHGDGVFSGISASTAAVRGLKRIAFDQDEGTSGNSSKETLCVICLDDFEAAAELHELPCRHRFHAKCITEWIQRKRSCPLCRFPLHIESWSKVYSTNRVSVE